MANKILERIIPQKRFLIFEDVFGENILSYTQWFGIRAALRKIDPDNFSFKKNKTDLLIPRDQSILELNGNQKPPFLDRYLSLCFSSGKKGHFLIQYIEIEKIKLWSGYYLEKGIELEMILSHSVNILFGILKKYKNNPVFLILETSQKLQVIQVNSQQFYYVSPIFESKDREQRLFFLKNNLNQSQFGLIAKAQCVVLRENENLHSVIRDLDLNITPQYIFQKDYFKLLLSGLEESKRFKVKKLSPKAGKNFFPLFWIIGFVFIIPIFLKIWSEQNEHISDLHKQKEIIKPLRTKKTLNKKQNQKKVLLITPNAQPTPTLDEINKNIFLSNVKVVSVVNSGREPLVLLQFNNNSTKLAHRGDWIDNFSVVNIDENSQKVDFLIDQKTLVSLYPLRK